jgi:hypothetical protein
MALRLAEKLTHLNLPDFILVGEGSIAEVAPPASSMATLDPRCAERPCHRGRTLTAGASVVRRPTLILFDVPGARRDRDLERFQKIS